MSLPKGFRKATAAERRVFGDTGSHKTGRKSSAKGPSDAEVKTFRNLVRRYKRRSGKNLDYLPEEIRKRVEKKTPDLIPGVREYRKMTAKERLSVHKKLEGYLRQKATTKKGYQSVIDKRFQTWKSKIPGLTKKQFEMIVKDGTFNDLKYFFDSDEIIDDIKAIIADPNSKKNAVDKYIKRMVKLTEMKSGKRAQQKYSQIREAIRSGGKKGFNLKCFLNAIYQKVKKEP